MHLSVSLFRKLVSSYWGPLTEDMSYVDHIEFVKGPSGFMLSSGEPSGLYNVVTKKPTGQTKGEFNLTVGSFDLYRSSLDSAGLTYLAGRVTYWEISPDPDQTLKDYFKLDGGLFWENDKVKINLNAFNVLNEYLYSGSYYGYLNAYYWQTDPPRNVRLSVAYSF